MFPTLGSIPLTAAWLSEVYAYWRILRLPDVLFPQRVNPSWATSPSRRVAFVSLVDKRVRRGFVEETQQLLRDSEIVNAATQSVETPIAGSPASLSSTETPKWDKDDGTLTFEGKLCRKITRTDAKHAIAVLDCFHEKGWSETVTIRRLSVEQLAQAIRDMNKALRRNEASFEMKARLNRVSWGTPERLRVI
jgi:hypothetical protein